MMFSQGVLVMSTNLDVVRSRKLASVRNVRD